MMSFGKTVIASSVAFGLVALWYSGSTVQMSSWGNQPMSGWQAQPKDSQSQQWQPPMNMDNALWALPATMPMPANSNGGMGGMGGGSPMAQPVQTAEWKPAEAVAQPTGQEAWQTQPPAGGQAQASWGDDSHGDTSKDDSWKHDADWSKDKDCDHDQQASWNDDSSDHEWGNKGQDSSDDWGSKHDWQASESDNNWGDKQDGHDSMAQTASWDGGSKQSQGDDWGNKHSDCDHQKQDQNCRHDDDCGQSDDCE